MIGLDLLGAPPPQPVNRVDSSQNIYNSNPLFFDKNAPAPTTATSYYPEAPGFVEDPRKLDVNRDFGMNDYVPQWDTPEQAMLGIDVLAGAHPDRPNWHTGGPEACIGFARGTSERKCPRCGAEATMWCKCALNETKYKCGHESNVCPQHKCVNFGASDHADARRCTCPPLTHCNVGFPPDARVGDTIGTPDEVSAAKAAVAELKRIYAAAGSPPAFKALYDGVLADWDDWDGFVESTKRAASSLYAIKAWADAKAIGKRAQDLSQRIAPTAGLAPPKSDPQLEPSAWAGKLFGIPTWIWVLGGGAIVVGAGAYVAVPLLAAWIGRKKS